MRIVLNVADVSSLHAVLRYKPELISDMSIAYRGAPWLSGFASFRFQERISGQWQTYCKRQLNGRVEQVIWLDVKR